MKSGSAFEELTAQIFEQLKNDPALEKVERNVMLPGVDAPRQIDVLVRGKVGPIDVLTIVECKDHDQKISVEAVDALHSKMQDVRAQKAVLVSRKGFSGTAIKKARRLGITLCTAHEAKSDHWKFVLELPFVFVEDSAAVSDFFFRFVARGNSHQFNRSSINGVNVSTLVARYWDANPLDLAEKPLRRLFAPPIPPPHWMWFDGNQQMPVTNCNLEVEFRRSYYFGYFNALDSARCLEFVGEDKRKVVYDPGALLDYRRHLVRYDRLDDVPRVANLTEIKLQVIDLRSWATAPAQVTKAEI